MPRPLTRSLLAVFLTVSGSAAIAHDIWISRGTYKNPAGEWCCGAEDCGVVDKSAVHAKTLYAAVNVARHSPPAPIFAELVSHPYYVLVGDDYWRFDQSRWTE